MMNTIPCFAINLSHRHDRRSHIIKEFEGHDEFRLTVVPAIVREHGARGLWETIQGISAKAMENGLEYFILCEDDHQFTDDYSPELLHRCIEFARQHTADMLLGGVSWSRTNIQVADNLFWIDKFTGLQFTVFFKQFYGKLPTTRLAEFEAVDSELGRLATEKLAVFPMISIQREFGYSDVTPSNNAAGHVSYRFREAIQQLDALISVRRFYSSRSPAGPTPGTFDEFVVPVYALAPNAGMNEWDSLARQFGHRPEFELKAPIPVHSGATSPAPWNELSTVIEDAIDHQNDVIIICNPGFSLSSHYDRDLFFSTVLQAASLSCDILLGDTGGIREVVPLTDHLFWVDAFADARLIVLFRKCFERILNERPGPESTLCATLSGMTSHKMLIYPLISEGGKDKWRDLISEKLDKIKNIIADMPYC